MRKLNEQDFWSLVNIRSPKECWPWKGRVGTRGYGMFGARLAHRVSLEFKLGRPLKCGMRSLHSCDTPICVNQVHLYEGTQGRNLLDASARRRIKIQRVPLEDKQKLRREYSVGNVTLRTLGLRYGVSEQRMWFIIRKEGR